MVSHLLRNIFQYIIIIIITKKRVLQLFFSFYISEKCNYQPSQEKGIYVYVTRE